MSTRQKHHARFRCLLLRLANRLSLAIVLALIATWFGFGWYAADQMLAVGSAAYDHAAEVHRLDELGLKGIEREIVEIRNGETILAGSFFPHSNPADCAVVVLPGIGGNRIQVLPILPLFRSLRCHVLAYDPRGTGASSDVPRTFGFLEKKDNAIVIRWLSRKTGLKLTSVGVWGPSFGAAVGLLTLEEIPHFGFVIADSTFANFETVVRETITQASSAIISFLTTPVALKFLEVRADLNASAIVPARSVVDATTPVLLIHALHDPDMDVNHTRTVFKSRTSDSTEMQITDWGASHADSALIAPQKYRALLCAFFARHETTQHIPCD